MPEMQNNVVQFKVLREDNAPTFDVQVYCDEGIWVAICDELPVATEANTYDELVQRVWEIAPEMVADNHAEIDANNFQLHFLEPVLNPSSALKEAL